MKIKSVTINKQFYFILRDDDYIHIQRRYTMTASENPLSSDEETIIALCDRIYNDEAQKIDIYETNFPQSVNVV